MSGYLWKSFLENDVATFRAVLEAAGYSTRGGLQKSYTGGPAIGLGIGSPGSLGKRGNECNPLPPGGQDKGAAAQTPIGLVLTRADINHRDSQGRTILHLAASSQLDTALEFANALLDHPLTDVYLQDRESGWTALHRAFYQGNLTIAHAILARDSRDLLGPAAGSQQHPGGLIKIKDKEGNAPFDLFEMTLEPTLEDGPGEYDTESDEDSGEEGLERFSNMDYAERSDLRLKLDNIHSLHGQEVYTFGNNKNITLGFGDGDDRQYPERIMLRRPEHLFQRFHEEFQSSHRTGQKLNAEESSMPQILVAKEPQPIPFFIRSKPTIIHDVQMAKFSTAVLTTDTVSNLYICGYGSGGRLGLGDERTRFQFTCIEGGVLAQKEIVSVALGHHHTMALSRNGDVFTWGSNVFGQLGYSLPATSKKEEPLQLVPRQIFGPLKRELVCGIAASGIHSAVYTATSLYTFGKNEGQLGIVDADARSLQIQIIPRKVGSSLFSAPIQSVSAIDKATVCLLKNSEVWVFANYGYSKVTFPLHWFENQFNSFSRFNKYTGEFNSSPICKISSGGDTICALSQSGNIFTITVSRPNADGSASTTNPNKIRGALSQSHRIWSNRKSRMVACDVDVDQNGSIILVTGAGSVWRRVKRAQIKDASASGIGNYKPKDYKFSRIPGLTSVVAVRASGFGAYAAVRKETRVPEMGFSSSPTMNQSLRQLSPYRGWLEDPTCEHISLLSLHSFPMPLTSTHDEMTDPDDIFKGFFQPPPQEGLVGPDLVLSTSSSKKRISTYQFLLAASSQVVRRDLMKFSKSASHLASDLMGITRDDGGRIRIEFQGLDILTVVNVVIYLAWGEAIPFFHPDSPKRDWQRAQQIRTELICLAKQLEIGGLEDAARGRVRQPGRCHALDIFFSSHHVDPSLLPGVDTIVQLSDGETKVHGALMCERCPFFNGLFQGRAGGRWLSDRRSSGELVRIDLTHFSSWAFDRVVRWVYADQLQSLFEDISADTMDSYLDRIIEVLSIADELMIQPLAEICQSAISKHITLRNVGQILVAIAPCHETKLKENCLNYICKNLEAVCRNGQLEELDEDLLSELDQTARKLQLDCASCTRNGKLEEELLKQHPELEGRIEQERQARIDSIVLLNKYTEPDLRGPSLFRAGSFHGLSESPTSVRSKRKSSSHGVVGSPSPVSTPKLKGKAYISDLIFDMEEEGDERGLSNQTTPPKNMSSPPAPAIDTVWKGAQSRQSSVGDQCFDASPSPALFLPEPLITPRRSSLPWQATPLPSAKLDMRTIMEQASQSRTSNLSLGLAVKPPHAHKSSELSSSHKMSQKERKKQQQQASLSPTAAPNPSLLKPTSKTSPWQRVPKVNAALLEINLSPSHIANGSTPQLTMRQTIANPGTPKDKSEATTPLPLSTTKGPPRRIPSNAETPTQSPMSRPSTATRTTSSSHQPPVQIQSIRHAPRSIASSSFLDQNLSMADIQSLQAAEKIVAAEAVSKRNLLDIQAEQQFQEWWDKESARIQEEEAAEAARTARGNSKTYRGGRGGRKRSGEGRGKKIVVPSSSVDAPTPSDPRSARGEQNRWRGKGKGKAGAD